MVKFQLRVEDGVHPCEVSSLLAASGECESLLYISDFYIQWWRCLTCSQTPSVLWCHHLSSPSMLSVCVYQIFWMTGSMLIIILGMLLVPTWGWRWMIRFSVAPSVILIFLFKVRHPPHLFAPTCHHLSVLTWFFLCCISVYSRVGSL